MAFHFDVSGSNSPAEQLLKMVSQSFGDTLKEVARAYWKSLPEHSRTPEFIERQLRAQVDSIMKLLRKDPEAFASDQSEWSSH